jgi:diguanylate cyclase (GGDEF)-like protein/PAS domain S-box-containing protein
MDAPHRPGLLLAAAVVAGVACVGIGALAGATLLADALAALALGAVAMAAVDAYRQSRRSAALLASLQVAETVDYAEPLSTDGSEFAGAVERMRGQLCSAAAGRHSLDAVLDSMLDAVLVTDDQGIITRSNAATERLLGWSAAELEGRAIVTLVAEQERRRFSLSRAVEETREYVMIARSGSLVPMALSGSRIAAERPGAATGCIFVGHDITERRRAERRVRYLARHDALTQIPNRLEFQHLLQQAIARSHRTKTRVALCYLDLDRFKDVNDSFGHAAGDRTLEILSERLTRIAPPDSRIGRLAGDEFALFVENLPPSDTVARLTAIVRQLLDELSRAFYLNETEVYLTASIGIALCDETSDNTIDLIRNADTAMYHAKQSGGGNYAFYDPQMSAATVERLVLKSKLRRSLELDEFVVLYQPKVELATGRLAGAEALLRWRLPGHGDIAPAIFIPLAEQTGLIQPIGEWVLRRVCSDYRRWHARIADPGRISINLSLRQLQQASFITQFAAVFREYDVEPDRFELEITETTLMSNAPRTMQVLEELRELGIRLSIDDFGTGYSSLSALQQMPVQTLKIDQSFVRNVGTDPEDATLVRTIIEMGRSLGMEIVAEGVETHEQSAFLRERGCNYGQGLLFGRPMTADAFLAMLQGRVGESPPAPRSGAASLPTG